MVVQLSPRFRLVDLIKSSTATRAGIDNTPGPLEIENLKALCGNVLEPICTEFGSIEIVSGFRGDALNKKIGGAKNSQHKTGEAADIEVRNVHNSKLLVWIKDNLQFDQLILEFHNPEVPDSGWVHVSFSRTKNRKEVLTATRDASGKTVYRVWND
jgi:hypothetical protein